MRCIRGAFPKPGRRRISPTHVVDQTAENGDPEARAGGAECRREAAERARHALSEIVETADAPCIGVVTHGGVVCSLVPELRLANAGFAVLDAAALLAPAAAA